ncbi:putative neutral sphingomyelinase [Ceratina calcarata]|uniref:sphingomyelin phosphodiesterase n=1 Tax=Ceratina calcarata TaxID=156304 RepID=A0AAJ7NEE0_9HYME|nr:putative neutral sphingomyelinase [Ceratina calcarata]
MTEEEVSISVLTLNCWGIPYVSRDRKARMAAIAEKFSKESYDVICLQEVWSIDDFKMIKAKTQEQLPYSHYFYSGVVGSGICILTRFPIKDVMFHKWPLNGYVHKLHHGDWFGGKGVALCRLQIQDMDVNVYVVHLHAEYNRDNDEYAAHRVLQAFDTAQFVRLTCDGADSAILLGDLNTEPNDLAYKIICGVTGLLDACSNTSSTNLGTHECANNSYTTSKSANACPEGKRIDYILYHGTKNIEVKATSFKHPFPNRVPGKNFSYSDHEAIVATFRFSAGSTPSANMDVRDSLKEGISICETALKSVSWQRYWYLLFSGMLIVPLVWSMGLDCSVTSADATIGLNVGRVCLSAVLCYALFMSSIWNSVEKNALRAGCSGMEIYLTSFNLNLYAK